ncbi:MAG: hypothetical protein ACRELX_06260 [Longimicrobiales bacterium]
MELSSTLLANLSAWGFALVPGLGRGGSAARLSAPPHLPIPRRKRTLRLPDADAVPGSLFLPAGPGPHPALVLDADNGAVNLRAEAHRFASIGIAALFAEPDEPRRAGSPADLAARAGLLRDRVDINPHEVGALWIGRHLEDRWVECASSAGAAFVVRVLLRPGMSGMARESAAPGEASLLEVLAGLTPLEPDVTRLVDDWLLRQVTIRA